MFKLSLHKTSHNDNLMLSLIINLFVRNISIAQRLSSPPNHLTREPSAFSGRKHNLTPDGKCPLSAAKRALKICSFLSPRRKRSLMLSSKVQKPSFRRKPESISDQIHWIMNIKLRFPCQARNDKRGQNRLLTRPSSLVFIKLRFRRYDGLCKFRRNLKLSRKDTSKEMLSLFLLFSISCKDASMIIAP